MYDEDYVDALNELFVQFWYNTVFNPGDKGAFIIDSESFEVLSEMCIDIERGQYEHTIAS